VKQKHRWGLNLNFNSATFKHDVLCDNWSNLATMAGLCAVSKWFQEASKVDKPAQRLPAGCLKGRPEAKHLLIVPFEWQFVVVVFICFTGKHDVGCCRLDACCSLKARQEEAVKPEQVQFAVNAGNTLGTKALGCEFNWLDLEDPESLEDKLPFFFIF
jgi:hypothetical protein